MVLIPENMEEAYELAKLAKKMGVDYFVAKPYSQHKKSINQYETQYVEEVISQLEQQCQNLRDGSFSVVIRHEAMDRVDNEQRVYKKCLSVPFFGLI